MSDEIELKLALSPDAPAKLRSHPLLQALETHVTTLGNRYFDTPERDLEHARVALRIRRQGERYLQTLKSAAISYGGLSNRGEWEWPIDRLSDHPHGLDVAGLEALAHPTLASIDLESLAPVFETNFERRLWYWRAPGDDSEIETEVEIALDQGNILVGDSYLPILELELELKTGPAAALWELARQLCDIHPVLPARPANHSKASRANALRWGWPDPLPAQDEVKATLDSVIDAIDTWQDSASSQWHAEAERRLAALAAATPQDDFQALSGPLAKGDIPWSSDVWLALRRSS